jgi:rubrerythrin
MTTDEVKQSGGRRLAELREASPVDSTLDNLLTLLRAELDLCARLPVFIYEASTEGYEESASLFRSLADAERAQVERVLTALQRHLAQRSSRTEASG